MPQSGRRSCSRTAAGPVHDEPRSTLEQEEQVNINHPTPLLSRKIPTSGVADFRTWAAELGERIDRDGVHGVDGLLRVLGQRASELQVEVVAAGVLADGDAPDVARARAFSRVVGALLALTPSSTVGIAAVA